MPKRTKEELEEIYLRRRLRKCDERISELKKGLFWLNVAEWTFYSLITIAIIVNILRIIAYLGGK